MDKALLVLLTLFICCCCRNSSSGQHRICNSRKVHIDYNSMHGNYVLTADIYSPEEKYRLTLSYVPNDSSFLPLVQFVRNAANIRSLNPVAIVFYATDTNTINFLNNNCSSTKAFIIYEGNKIKFKRRLFKESEAGLFLEDTSNTEIVPIIAFNYIRQELIGDIKTHYPDVEAYHLYTSSNYVTSADAVKGY